MSKITRMEIRRDRQIDDSDDEVFFSRFDFQHYLRDGTKKYLDAAGNAVLINRADVVVSIYSHDAGTDVDVLDIPNTLYRPRWPIYSTQSFEEEKREESIRREQLRPAWDQMIASLPPPEGVSAELRRAVSLLQENLEWSVVSAAVRNQEHHSDPLADAHDAVESLTELCSTVDVSGLLLQIAKSATSR